MKPEVKQAVMAKWPGSSLYFHAKVTAIDDESQVADVIFDQDQSETMKIDYKYISAEKLIRPKRSKSRSSSRRRSRSPARSPARQKANKSIKNTPATPRGRSRILMTSSSSDESKVTITRVDGQEVTKKTEKVEITRTKVENTPISDSRYMMTRQKKKALLSSSTEEDDIGTIERSRQVHGGEYGGVLGVFVLLVTTPLLPLVTLIASKKVDYDVTKLTWTSFPCTLDAYYDPKAFLIVGGYLLFNALIYALPFGHVINGPVTHNGKTLPYRISAMHTLILTLAAYGGLYYYKIKVAFILDDLLQLAFACTVISYVGTLVVYFMSFQVPSDAINPAANTGSHLYDLFMGRQLHPRIGELFDLKLYLYRPAMGGWLVLLLIALQTHYEATGSFTPQLLIVAISQILYIFFEFFWDEEMCPFMFDIKNEGLGFVQFFGELVIVPFVYSLPTFYVIDNPTNLPLPKTIMLIVFMFVGFVLIFASGSQKSQFRKNPFDPKLSNLESLPPSRVGGDRILVSGWWGLVRHPNYLGEIIVGMTWSLACGYNHFMPWFYPIFLIGLLCDRALRDEKRCAHKHGLVWKVYCQRVKYRVFPYIF